MVRLRHSKCSGRNKRQRESAWRRDGGQRVLSGAGRVKAGFGGRGILGIDQVLVVEWSLDFLTFPLRRARMNPAVRDGLGLGELIFGMI